MGIGRKIGSRDVIDLIKLRKKQNSTPGNREDRAKLAVVCEGGGMRGVVVGGMLMAMQDLELLDAVDGFFGTSAGAYASAYALSNSADIGTSIYYENINNLNFISIWRLLNGKIMNMDYLVHIMKHNKPFIQDYVRSDIPLHISATCVESGKCDSFILQDDIKDWSKLFMCTGKIPIVSGSPTLYKGKHYYDGGIVQQIPYEVAIEKEYTHILVLTPRPFSNSPSKFSLAELFASLLFQAKYPSFSKALRRRRSKIYKAISNLKNQHFCDAQKIFPVFLPSSTNKISRLEKGQPVLVRGAIDGYSAICELFDTQEKPFVSIRSNSVIRHDKT